MAHENWCGKPCGECNDSCKLDETIPCSPNCEGLNPDGTRNAKICIMNGCDGFEIIAGICPVCGYEGLSFVFFLNDKLYSFKWTCNECGSFDTQICSLDFINHIANKSNN